MEWMDVLFGDETTNERTNMSSIVSVSVMKNCSKNMNEFDPSNHRIILAWQPKLIRQDAIDIVDYYDFMDENLTLEVRHDFLKKFSMWKM